MGSEGSCATLSGLFLLGEELVGNPLEHSGTPHLRLVDRQDVAHHAVDLLANGLRVFVPHGDAVFHEVGRVRTDAGPVEKRVMPLVEVGGHMPALDHNAPPDVSWPNFIEYVEFGEYRLGRG
jgi:hypothetical protein